MLRQKKKSVGRKSTSGSVLGKGLPSDLFSSDRGIRSVHPVASLKWFTLDQG